MRLKIGKVKDKKTSFSNLVRNLDCNTKISDIEANYFITSDHSNFASKIIEMKINKKEQVHKSNISNLVKKSVLT